MSRNNDRLVKNQKEIVECVEKYIQTYEGKENINFQLLENRLKKSIMEVIEISEYSKAMDWAEELRDAQLSISRACFANTDGSKVLIRDARHQDAIAAHNSPASYLLQRINAVNAAIKVLKSVENPRIAVTTLNDVQSDLNAYLTSFVHKVEGRDANMSSFYAFVRSRVIDAGIRVHEFDTKIQSALHFSSLEKPQYHVVTLGKVQSRIIVESDVMLLGLSPQQQAQYYAINEAKQDACIELLVDDVNVDMSWYNVLPQFTKSLIKEHAGEIMQGNKCLHNQLKAELIGLRNAYSKSTYIVNKDNGNELELIQRVMHSGTLSFHGHGDKQHITTENAKQLASFLENDKKASVVMLNSPANPRESAIHQQVTEAQREVGGLCSTTPFNDFRRFSANHIAGFQAILDLVANNILYHGADHMAEESDYDSSVDRVSSPLMQKSSSSIMLFLQSGKKEQGARLELEDIKSRALQLGLALEHAINAKSMIDKKIFLIDPNNRNLQLVTEMALLGFAIERGDISSACEAQYMPLLVQCKSGKDRTGLAMTSITSAAVAKKSDVKIDEILPTIIKGGHTQIMASLNGGTPGCHGIKKESTTGFSRLFRRADAENHLYQPTAGYTSFIIPKPFFLIKLLKKIVSKMVSFCRSNNHIEHIDDRIQTIKLKLDPIEVDFGIQPDSIEHFQDVDIPLSKVPKAGHHADKLSHQRMHQVEVHRSN